MGDIYYLLPDIIRIFDFRTPLTEIVSFAVGYQAVFGNEPETVSRIVCIAVLQNVGTLFINLETFSLSVFIQNVFRTIVYRIFKHLCRSRVEG